MRLDKFVCKSTRLTRAQATAMINTGCVVVNDAVVCDVATQVHEDNYITLNNEKLIARASRYILMHKPAGTICSNIDEVYPSLFNYIDVDNVSELHVAGRLDADTTGLVLVTDDGRWSFNIITPTKHCQKVYRVGLSRTIGDDVANQFSHGVQLQGEQQLTRPAILEIVAEKEVLLTLTEGKFHQVKRMFSAVDNRVVSLHREKIGEIQLDVEVGEWRYLTEPEVNSFSN
ncbi:pseudouridine synthase [Psychromonas marina]|uniref:Pseudouridine synthase n=1 Tax=Psychromonas marina TaxID=88364 RepID=A0ABQ6DWH3_9GAMM|nr:pseudouridine synthase [Psychromonas marina]GLS89340.1 pseudouridine synthase [Psychromonas marina]